jgi:type III pantothenate kinase
MLFVLDVGNTNTVLGVFARAEAQLEKDDALARYDHLLANWRVATRQGSTVDEYGVLFRNLFSMASLEASGIHGIVISSVVPPLDPVLRLFSLSPA